jgi:hypothetical protein
MPSVVAEWEGQCRNKQFQEQVCGEIGRLARCSHRLYEEYFQQKIDSIFYDGGQVHQKVLLGRDLFYRRPVPAGVRKLEEATSFKEMITLHRPDGTVSASGIREEIYFTEQAALYGVEFLLYDPRAYNYPFGVSSSLDTSFTFLRSENPDLDGRLVLARKVNPEGPLAPFGELILHTPTLDLRYYLEGWTRCLLAWVKHFYVPDLYYWLYVDNGGEHCYQDLPPGDAAAARSAFDRLLEDFTEEAREFTAWCNKTDEKEDGQADS